MVFSLSSLKITWTFIHANTRPYIPQYNWMDKYFKLGQFLYYEPKCTHLLKSASPLLWTSCKNRNLLPVYSAGDLKLIHISKTLYLIHRACWGELWISNWCVNTGRVLSTPRSSLILYCCKPVVGGPVKACSLKPTVTPLHQQLPDLYVPFSLQKGDTPVSAMWPACESFKGICSIIVFSVTKLPWKGREPTKDSLYTKFKEGNWFANPDLHKA